MKNLKWILLIIACANIFAACKKVKTDATTIIEEEKLPPITQTGANTFGCLINGKVWLPKGFDGNFTNSRINIDPTFIDGDLTIRTYKIDVGTINDLSIGSDSIKAVGIYPIGKFNRAKFVIQKAKSDLTVMYCLTNCSIISENVPIGFIKVTRYDLVNKIFSGEFEFTFNNTDCGYGTPVKITAGRFDYRL